MLPVLLLIWVWSHGGPGPYVVPCWRWGTHLLELPMPPELFNIAAFVAAALACLMLIFGSRRRWPILIILAVEAYYGSRDLLAFHCSFVTLSFWFTIALLFDNDGEPSCARRLIQIAIFSCYFFSVLQKCLFPDFLAGWSFQGLFSDGWPLRSFLRPLVVSYPVPLEIYRLMSWATIGLEAFLAVGLFLKQTRTVALIIGFLFHLAILIILDDSNVIAVYSLFMFAGYLAFMNVPSPEVLKKYCKIPTDSLSKPWQASAQAVEMPASLLQPAIKLQKRLAILFICSMFIVPMRIYFWPGRPCTTLNYFDRSPASFAMFLMREEPDSISVKYQGVDGIWHDLPIKGRMTTASSDNEILALSNYVFASIANVSKVRIDVSMTINKHWTQTKVFESGDSVLVISDQKNVHNSRSTGLLP